jgi:competence protein ComFC
MKRLLGIKSIPGEKNWLDFLGSGLGELFFAPPAVCPACLQERSLRQGLGRNCLDRVMLIMPPVCVKCGRPLRLKMANRQICRQCATTEFYFSEARAVAVYAGALREYLAELKYSYRPELGLALGELLVEWIKANRDFQSNDLLLPIPIHRERMARRGYNQTELLAKPLERYLGVKISVSVLEREKDTANQNALNKSERFANVKKAFRVVKPNEVAGKRVLLVDDILTTGATVSEAARVLLKAGALKVKVLTLAAGVIEADWLEQ